MSRDVISCHVMSCNVRLPSFLHSDLYDPLRPDMDLPFIDYLFQFQWFSLGMMTTLGMGDVAAVHPVARLVVISQCAVQIFYSIVILGMGKCVADRHINDCEYMFILSWMNVMSVHISIIIVHVVFSRYVCYYHLNWCILLFSSHNCYISLC